MKKNSMMIIDGNSILFRAFYAMPPFKNKDGIVTNAVYGFLSMMYKLIEKFEPKYLCVAFDAKGPTFRHKKFEEYKAKRASAPDELIPQFALIRELLNQHDIKYIEIEGFEADDIAGTLAKDCSMENIPTYLVTSDKDYLQLIDENVHVLLTKKGVSELKEMDVDAMKEEYEMTPKEFIDLKALMGDSSDNIPGVKGIGVKTGIKFIKQYGSIENLYDHIDEIKGKNKEKLENDKINAFLSKELATIITDMFIEFDINDYLFKKFNYNLLVDRFKYLNFKTLIKKLDNLSIKEDIEQVAVVKDEKSEKNSQISLFDNISVNDNKMKSSNQIISFDVKKVEIIDGVDEKFDEMIKSLESEDKIYFKFIFDDKRALFSGAISLMILSNDIYYYIKLDDNHDECLLKMKKILEDKKIKKYGHHLKEDVIYLLKNNIYAENIYFDSAVAKYIVNAENYNDKIDIIAYEYLSMDIPNIVDYIGKGVKEKKFTEIEEEKRIEYLYYTLMTVKESESKLEADIEKLQSTNVFHNIEMPLIMVLADMEFRGFEIDASILKNLKTKYQSELDIIRTDIYKLCQKEFNINSPKQLGVVLFEELKLTVIKKTKTGYSTNIEVLNALKEEHEVIEKIIQYRQLTKLISTYLDGLAAAICEDGRIHSVLNQTITATGRISSSEPNLQNIPTRSERGREIRKAFVAKDIYSLLDADYSQIELRVLAELSGESKLIEAFEQGADIHSKTASEVFKMPLETVTKEQRSKAKAVNFGIIYGISQFGLAKDLNISRGEAKEYIENYLSSYPNIDNYMKLLIANAKMTYTSETYFGRRRHIAELESRNFNIRALGERIALNTPIQGTAADIIKIAMLNVYNRLRDENLEAKLIMQIHDELIIEAPQGEIEQASKILKEEMEKVVPDFTVNLDVDLNVGNSWDEAK